MPARLEPGSATSACCRSAHGSPPPTARASASMARSVVAPQIAVDLDAEAALELAQGVVGARAEDSVDGAGEQPEDDEPLLQRRDVVAAHELPAVEQQRRGRPAASGRPRGRAGSGCRRRRPRAARDAAGTRGRRPRGRSRRRPADPPASSGSGVTRSIRRAEREDALTRVTRPQRSLRQEAVGGVLHRGQPSQAENSRSRIGFGLAPMTVLTSSPPEYTASVGSAVTPYAGRHAGFSSVLIFTTSILSACAPAISSRIGETWRHGRAPRRPEVDDHRLVGLEDVQLEAGVGHGLGLAHQNSSVRNRYSNRVRSGGWTRSACDGRGRGGGGVRRALTVGVALVREGGEVALGVEGGRAAGAGRRDGLPVLVVHDVAAGEDAGHAGAAASAVRRRRSPRRRGRPGSRNSSTRGSCPMATNRPVAVEVGLLAGDGVAQRDRGDLVVAEHLGRPGCSTGSRSSGRRSARAA